MLKKLIIICLYSSFLFASYEEVKIGKIDAIYKNKLSSSQLRLILKEIENTLEKELNLNLFDLKNTGKPIDILYLAPSNLEKRIVRKNKTLKRKEKKLQKLQDSFPLKEEKINIIKDDLNYKTTILNNQINELNTYIKTINKQRTFSKTEYEKIQRYIKSKKVPIKLKQRELKKVKNKYRKLINSYNQKIHLYNTYSRDFNRLSNELESMNRSIKRVKGKTFGIKEVQTKTTYKDGKKIKTIRVKNSMNKIEIYGFDTLDELKVVLAHELLHLVGIPHINKKGALMHPFLQKEQKELLKLTQEDIKNIKIHF